MIDAKTIMTRLVWSSDLPFVDFLHRSLGAANAIASFYFPHHLCALRKTSGGHCLVP
jgi:hypothetical protein